MSRPPRSHEQPHEHESCEVLSCTAVPTREEILAELAEIRRMERPGRWRKAERLVREDRDRP
jgi:hypothetical protein